jgi:predicted RNase H-like HicB family nuclease
MNRNYSISIQWSEEDHKFIAHLPEFGPYAHTHGNTYANALENALEVLELLIEDYTARHKALPTPRIITKLDFIAA